MLFIVTFVTHALVMITQLEKSVLQEKLNIFFPFFVFAEGMERRQRRVQKKGQPMCKEITRNAMMHLHILNTSLTWTSVSCFRCCHGPNGMTRKVENSDGNSFKLCFLGGFGWDQIQVFFFRIFDRDQIISVKNA